MRNIRWIIPFLLIIIVQAGCMLSEKSVWLEGHSMKPNYDEGLSFRIESIYTKISLVLILACFRREHVEK
jgi:hypothetical protein